MLWECHDQTFSRDHSHDRRPRDLSPDERLTIKNFVSSHKPYCPPKVRLETLSRFRLYTQHIFPPIMPVTEDPYHADPYRSYSGFVHSSMFHRSYIKDQDCDRIPQY